MPRGRPRGGGAGRAANTTANFHDQLVLNQWALAHFADFPALKARLADPRLEALVDGQTGWFDELTRGLFDPNRISTATLRRYDLNILAHWNAITARRGVMSMKYFQYLSLLFTELYLDQWANNRVALLAGLNQALADFMATPAGNVGFAPYVDADLDRLAFWNATGSGKTLLMHVNILQFQHYAKAKPDRIILVTPNEGLSHQHLDEFAQSGFSARLFDASRPNDLLKPIEIIEITRLAETSGDKTVAVSAFEGNNLILVDEGHRGLSSAGKWLQMRQALAKDGFTFEYSATLGQAVRGANNPLREPYAKSILFDYSYKYFYADGYGKESLILNLEDARYGDKRDLYFTACLLSFYQQLWLWDENKDQHKPFNIERPLAVFVGNRVQDAEGDVFAVINYLARMMKDPATTKAEIAALLRDDAAFFTASGLSIFAGRFTPLTGRTAEQVYPDLLKRVFNAAVPGQLTLVNLKTAKGEIALRVGTQGYFGVINVGDDDAFFNAAKNMEKAPFATVVDEFGPGLFAQLNKDDRLTMLIGSRKFSEGWSSWRVSTMGLLNMGQGEGSQIIQMFGRGVRLKGREMSLKRSTPADRAKLKGFDLLKLETLNIFGVNAGYMSKFREYLKEEDIPTGGEDVTLTIDTVTQLPSVKLKTLKLRDGYRLNQANGFKRQERPTLFEVPNALKAKIKPIIVNQDEYPRLEAMGSAVDKTAAPGAKHAGKIPKAAMAFFDWDALYLSVQRHKLINRLDNLMLDRAKLEAFCLNHDDWYVLQAPEADLAFSRMDHLVKLEAILERMLIAYTDIFYERLQRAYEGEYLGIAELSEKDGIFVRKYEIVFAADADGLNYKANLDKLAAAARAENLAMAKTWVPSNGVIAISNERHLFFPLLGLEKGVAAIRSLRPNSVEASSERRFVQDLLTWIETPGGVSALDGRKLYLLRNGDRESSGVGFARAGNFYPDFLLWLVDETADRQSLIFIDPKGLRNIGLNDPKLQLAAELKERERTLAGKLALDAFVLSATPFAQLTLVGAPGTRADYEAKNVLFLDEGPNAYLPPIFNGPAT